MIFLLTSALASPEVIEVVVTADRSAHGQGEHPVAVEVIDRASLESSGAETVSEALQEHPGVQIERTVTGTAVRLQGMEAEHTLVLIDGKRVLGRKDGVIDLERLTVANLERIEIVKGPSSAVFGSDAIGGVVNLITRDPDALEVGAHLRIGTQTRVDLDGDLSGAAGPFRLRAAAGWHNRNAWDRDPSTPATDASASVQGNLDGSAAIDLGARGGMELTLGYQQRRLEGIDSNIAGAVLDRLQTIEDARASMSGWWEAGESTRLDLSLSTGWYKDQFLQDQRGGKALDMTSTTAESNVEASAVLTQQWHEHRLVFGFDGLTQRLETDRFESGKAFRARGGLFAQGTFLLRTRGPDLRVSPGVRGDLDTQFGPAWAPSLATSATWERLVLRANTGLGYRAPDFRELYLLFENPSAGYVVVGSEELRPERSSHVGLGATVSPTDWLQLEASAFSNWIRDLIAIGDVDLEPGALQRFSYENIDRAWTAGGEIGGQITPGPLQLGITAALTHAWDQGRQRRLPGRVPFRLTTTTGIDLTESWSVRMRSGLSSAQVFYTTGPDGTDEAVNGPLIHTVDVRTQWAIAGPMTLFGGVDNLGDVKGPTLGRLAPRLFYAGFTFRDRPETP